MDVAAKIIGISIQSLKIAEKGEKKSHEVLTKIAMAYDVPVDYFIKYAYKDEIVIA